MTDTQHPNLTIFGDHDQRVVDQLARCVGQEDGSLGVLCADGHFGYSAPIGGVVAYRDHVSPAAVGYDIGCIAAGARVTTSAGFHSAIEDLRPTDRPARPDDGGCVGAVDPYVGVVPRGEKPVLKLTLLDGRTLRLTPDHELRVRSGWKRCDELSGQDAVLCPVTQGLPFEPSTERVEFIRWLAYVNGDGHLRKDGSQCGITTSQWEDVSTIVADLEALGCRPSVSTRRRPNGSYEASVRVADRRFVAQLVAAGAPVGKKAGKWTPRLCEYVLALPAWQRAQYLSAFASAAATTPTYLQGPRNLVIKQNGADALGHVSAVIESLGFRWAVTRDSVAAGGCHVGQLQGGTDEQLRFFREVGFCYAAAKRRAAAAVTSKTLLAAQERRGRSEVPVRMRELITTGARVRDAARAVGTDAGLSEAACLQLYYRSGRAAPRARARRQARPDNLGECVWVPVGSVEVDGVADVYDVVTDDPLQAFIAAGVTVHNCGNLAVATNVHADGDFKQALPGLMDRVFAEVSFGMGRSDGGVADHPVFDKIAHAEFEPQRALLSAARKQLGTVGAGNHYVDLLADETGRVWIGVHFGSRGFGHKTASGFLAMAQGGAFTDRGSDGEMESAPDVLRVDSALGHGYIAAMRLAGEYAYAGREVVVDQVLAILGAQPFGEPVHNHHNYAWQETHAGEDFWVVRKGATPAAPGQRGFVGATMGEPAVILEGVESPTSEEALYSTVHGAGRAMSRTAAAGRTRRRTRCNTRDCTWIQPPRTPRPDSCPECGSTNLRKTWVRESEGAIDWAATTADLRAKGIELRGANAEEAPGAYKRLDEVLAAHAGTVRILHTLTPLGVAMAPGDTRDPYKD